LNTWWSAAAYWLVDVYAMATVVLAAGLIALWGNRQPARRLAVARWTLRVLLCVPLLPLLTRTTGAVNAVPDLELLDLSTPCSCEISGADSGGLLPTLLTVFASCSSLVVAWLTLGALATGRLVTRSTEAPPSLRSLLKRVVSEGLEHPRLRVGGVSQPVAFGLLQPTIVLPGWFVESEPEERIGAALAHEWAHLRGGDLWTLAASRLLFVLFFAHPLFYVLRGRLRADQEVLADAEAAGPVGKLAYAEALVGWARRSSSPSIGSSLSLLGRSSVLRKRVTLLLDSQFSVERSCPRVWMVVVRASAAVLVTALGVLASTGTARTALSNVVPVTPRIVPHSHPSETTVGPSLESDVQSWPALCRPRDLCCPTTEK
jgi:beta-lactamase regulating signal transducer with metallopeptidase domain